VQSPTASGRGSRFYFTARFGIPQGASAAAPGEPGDLLDLPVLVVDDIVDTGYTMQWILRYLELKHPGIMRVASLLDKPARREYDVHIDYLGFVVPNVFVAGYGLDGLDDTMANVPRIVAVEDTDGEVEIPPRRARLPVF